MSNFSRNNANKTDNTIEPTPPSSSSFSDIITKLVSSFGQSVKNNNKSSSNNSTLATELSRKHHHQQRLDNNNNNSNTNTVSNTMNTMNPTAPFWPSSHWPSKRQCNAPPSRRFGHPCSCSHQRVSSSLSSSPSSSSSSLTTTTTATATITNASLTNNTTTATNNSLPPSAGPVYLYDPVSKKCLPTSRSRDMLLKDCHSHAAIANTHPSRAGQMQNLSCHFDDLTCDPRRFRCICKPHLQLYYESNEQTTFACVPLLPNGSPDGRVNCRQGQVYNVISRECQKVFDVSELPPTNIASVSAIQFLFVTFTLIWFLLLILLVTTKLKKLRTLNIYRGSPATERRRLDGRRGMSGRHPGQGTSAWLHPFIAAVNGHHHLNQHRTTVDRHTQSMLADETGPYSDTDFFLANGNRRSNELYPDRNHSSSQLSLNNPPPKFEEIYPSCPAAAAAAAAATAERHSSIGVQPPVSTEDLPSYDEAMKLQDGGGGGGPRSSPIEKE